MKLKRLILRLLNFFFFFYFFSSEKYQNISDRQKQSLFDSKKMQEQMLLDYLNIAKDDIEVSCFKVT